MTDQLVTADRQPSLLVGLIKELRPKQWAKNVLVFAAPGAGGALTKPTVAFQAFVVFCIFCAASGATYLINDIVDVESDRRHPTKRTRPIAAGVVPVPLACFVAGAAIVAALGFALWRNSVLLLIVALYIVLTTLYSSYFKKMPVLDLVALSGGFVLRLLGGGYGTDVAPSDWFLIISLFGSLFIAVGKREAERRELGDDAAVIRPTLGVYSDRYLAFLKSLSAGAVLMAYCLWAVDHAKAYPGTAVWVELSMVPFVVAVLRYALLVELGHGSAPEEVILGDRQMQVIGLIWAAILGVGIYVV